MTVTAPSNSAALAGFKTHCPVRERSSKPLVKVEGLAYFVVKRPDIEAASQFFVDFGLLVDSREGDSLYLRGRSPQHHALIIEKGNAKFDRLGLTASTMSVQILADHFDLPVLQRSGPMGGRYIALEDPNGLTLEINCELSSLTPIDKPVQPEWNTSDSKKRINATVRKTIAPPPVNKLGHTVHSVKSIKESVHWYQDTLGLIVSDFQFLADDSSPIVAFLRCDRGDTPTDHHTIALALVPNLGHEHTAFELDSMEEIAIGQECMVKKHHKHAWGIGRHILGSQIFDYWRDAAGDMFEHYADGDLFIADTATGYHPFHSGAQHQWGPSMSASFTGADKPWNLIKSLIKRLPSDDELSLKKLKSLSKALKTTTTIN